MESEFGSAPNRGRLVFCVKCEAPTAEIKGTITDQACCAKDIDALWAPDSHRDYLVLRPPQNCQLLISRAGSTRRCDTIQYIDSRSLPREKRPVWLYSVKT